LKKHTVIKLATLSALIALMLLLLINVSAASDTHIINWVNSQYCTISQDAYNSSSVCKPARNNPTEHIVNLNFSFTGNAGKYAAEIRIPAHIFTDRAGNKIGTFEVPLPKYDLANTDISEPPNAATKFNWRYDSATDEIVISNYAPIEDNFFLKVQVKYNVKPSEVKNGYKNTFNATMDVLSSDTNTTERYASNNLNIEYITNADLSSLSKYSYSVYRTWQSRWGAAPTGINTDDYFFICWRIYGNAGYNDTQPYSVSFKETIPASDDYGTLFAVESSKTNGLKRCTLDEYNNTINNPFATVNNPSPSSSATWYSYVYYMYPKTLLDKDGKATVRNKVDLALEGVDGARDSRTANSSYNYVQNPVTPPPTVPGNYAYMYKYNYGTSYGAINKLEFNDEQNPIPVTLTSGYGGNRGNFYFYGYTQGWRHTEQDGVYGVLPYTSELYDDRLQLAGTDLTDGDYQYSRLYFQGFTAYIPSTVTTSYNYVAKPNADYEPLTLQVKKNGVWSDYATIQKQANGQYSYTPIGNTSSVATGSYLDIPLPEGTTGVKYIYTDKVIRVYFNASYLTTQLLPSEKVLGLIKDRQSTYVRNYAYCRSLDNNNKVVTSRSYNASHTLTRVRGTGYHHKSWSAPVNDILTSRFYFPITLNAYTEIQHPEVALDEVLKGKYLVEQKISTFYDLLPPGTYADLSTITVTGYGTTGNDYNKNNPKDALKKAPAYVNFPTRIEVHDNWKGSGRTMLIVHAQAPESYTNLNFIKHGTSYSTLQSGMILTFNLYNTWLNAIDNGTTIYNYSAYETQNGEFYNAYPDNAASGYIPSNLKHAFTDLNRDGNPADTAKSFLYANATPYYKPLDAAELGFNKAVASPENPAFGDFVRVQAGGEYTYRLRLENAVASAKNLIYYDILENAYDTPNHWQGSLVNVDVSHAKSRGIGVKTYYTTRSITDNEIRGNANHLDNNKGTTWIDWDANPPADPGQVTALAFDLRKTTNGVTDFVAKPGVSVLVNITMRAPVDIREYYSVAEGRDYLAYNKAFCVNKKSSLTGAWDDVPSIEACNPVTVALKDMGMEFSKVSDPATGTELNPTIVYGGDTINYTLNFSNNNLAQSIQDIIVEDNIPAGLAIDASNIEVMLDDNTSTKHNISVSTRADVQSINGNKITIRIISLAGKEKISLIIPCRVLPMAENKPVDFNNTATIKSVYGKSVTLSSETTYHKQKYTEVAIPLSKTLTGRNMEAGEFTFLLKDGGGNIIQTITSPTANDGVAGNASFATIYYDSAGVYNYSVEELIGSLDSVTYDTTKFDVTVTVTKDSVTGDLTAITVYKDKLSQATVDNISFNNEYVTTTYKGQKIWDVGTHGDATGLTHTEVELQLLRDGEPYGEPQTFIPSDEWKKITSPEHIWNNLPMYRKDGAVDSVTGERIKSVYKVIEPSVPHNYIYKNEEIKEGETVVGNKITNKYWPNARTVRKVWDGPVPVPVVNETLVTMTINQAILNSAPVPDGDKPYSDSQHIITVPFIVDPSDPTKPAIEMNGIADEYPNPLPDDLHGEFSPWTYTITLPTTGTYNGPTKDGGTYNGDVHYYYTINETTMPDDYKKGTVVTATAKGATVENVYQKTSFTANKVWVNGPETKPTIWLQLLRSGVNYLSPVKITSGTTSYTWENLPKYDYVVWDPNNRVEFEYTVKEVKSETDLTEVVYSETFPYKTTYNVDNSVITNTYEPWSINIQATKTWVNGPAADHYALPLMLYRTLGIVGAEKELVTEFTPTVEQDIVNPNKYNYTWSGVPKTDINGTLYIYEVKELTDNDGFRYVNGNKYKMTQIGDDITNTYQVPKTDFNAYKTWVGGKADDYHAVELVLSRHIEGGEPKEVDSAPEPKIFPDVPGESHYSYVWSPLPATDNNGVPYIYTVSERHAENGTYTVNANKVNERKYAVTQHENAIENKFSPQPTNRYAIKLWEGGNPKDHKPVPFQATRTIKGVEGAEPEVVYWPYTIDSREPGLGKYEYKWEGLPMTDMYDNIYVYSIEEFSAINHNVLVNNNTYNVMSEKDISGLDWHIRFTNTFVPPENCKLSFAAQKTVSGDEYKIKEGDFAFRLQGKGIDVEAKNNSAGYVIFPEITFSKAGNYSFTLSEVKGDIAHMTYDDSLYTINVEVTQNYVTNKFEAKVTSILKNGESFAGGIPVFDNTYLPPLPAAKIAFSANKTVSGDTYNIKGGEFNFLLKGKGVEIEAKNNAAGDVVFPEITFSEAGNYSFTLNEVKGAIEHMTYDDSVYTINVEVTQNYVANVLEAKISILKNGESFSGGIPVFNNAYALPKPEPPKPDPPQAIGVTISANKELIGASLKAGQFEFVLRDSTGLEIDRQRNDADGKIVFGKRGFSNPGVYMYSIEEVIGASSDIIYDKSKIKVKISVNESGGKLSADVSYSKDGGTARANAKFSNCVDIPPTGDSTPIIILTLAGLGLLTLLAYLYLKRRGKHQFFPNP